MRDVDELMQIAKTSGGEFHGEEARALVRAQPAVLPFLTIPVDDIERVEVVKTDDGTDWYAFRE